MTEQHSTRTFDTGATRDTANGKFDYEGFLSPLVIHAFGTYMTFNRELADGSTRDSDNWQRGIPCDVYMKSAWRHFLDWWMEHRGLPTKDGIVWAILAIMFNVMGYLHEYLKAHPHALDDALAEASNRRNKARMEARALARRTEQANAAFVAGYQGQADAKYDHRTPIGDREDPYAKNAKRVFNGCTVEEQIGDKWPVEGEPRDVLEKQMLAGDPGSTYPKAGRFA